MEIYTNEQYGIHTARTASFTIPTSCDDATNTSPLNNLQINVVISNSATSEHNFNSERYVLGIRLLAQELGLVVTRVQIGTLLLVVIMTEANVRTLNKQPRPPIKTFSVCTLRYMFKSTKYPSS
jgi:hypothetical protein